MVIVLGSAVVKQGSLEEALALSQEHVSRSRAEPGCISHGVHRDHENPLRLVFVEQWESQDLLWQHFKLPASRLFGKALGALATEPASLAIYEGTPVHLPQGKGAA